MKDLMGMMSKVREMQARMQKVQEELEALTVDGQSGGGLVRVTLNGKGDMQRVSIDPSLMKPDEAEIVEDLIVAAAQDADVDPVRDPAFDTFADDPATSIPPTSGIHGMFRFSAMRMSWVVPAGGAEAR